VVSKDDVVARLIPKVHTCESENTGAGGKILVLIAAKSNWFKHLLLDRAHNQHSGTKNLRASYWQVQMDVRIEK
jgi:hypothetical protein